MLVYQLEENGGSTSENDENSGLGSLMGFDDEEEEYHFFISSQPAKYNRQGLTRQACFHLS